MHRQHPHAPFVTRRWERKLGGFCTRDFNLNTFHALRFWLIALVLATSVGNAAAQLLAPGPAFKSGVSTCGGLTPNGSLEPPCAATAAVFESAAVGNCPSGSFFDLGTWACYSCPSGYDRGNFTDAIDGPQSLRAKHLHIQGINFD